MAIRDQVVFDPYSIEFFEDPFPIYARMRDEAPVYFNERYGFWALSRYQDVLDASLNWQVFSSSHGSVLSNLTDPNYQAGGRIISIDPPYHTRLRALVSRAFSPRSIARMEGVVREVINSVLLTLEGRTNFDLVTDFTAIFPNEIISTVLGIPESGRSQIRQWTDDILHREEGTAQLTDRTVRAVADQMAFFKQLIADKRTHPLDDMISALIQAEVEDEHGKATRLSDDEIADFSYILGVAGTETVTKLVANAAVLLQRHGAQRELLLNDMGKLPAAVDEVLRYWAPSHLQGRITMDDITIHGVSIPKSSPVFLMTGSANRDPRAYPDPDAFDISRTDLPVPLGFGLGVHYCIGAALARTESRLSLREILTRWPNFVIDETGLERVHMANVAGFSHVPFSTSG
jgi:cytochrome P450